MRACTRDTRGRTDHCLPLALFAGCALAWLARLASRTWWFGTVGAAVVVFALTGSFPIRLNDTRAVRCVAFQLLAWINLAVFPCDASLALTFMLVTCSFALPSVLAWLRIAACGLVAVVSAPTCHACAF